MIQLEAAISAEIKLGTRLLPDTFGMVCTMTLMTI